MSAGRGSEEKRKGAEGTKKERGAGGLRAAKKQKRKEQSHTEGEPVKIDRGDRKRGRQEERRE